jgi:IclR family KDG regulon transcriptional repressor
MLLKLVKVLALFSYERPELSARDIAARFRWPKSTAYRILNRIEAGGFLDRDERTGMYRLGMRLAVWGELARHSTSLQRIADPVLRGLSAETSETATLMVLDGTIGVTVQVVESFQPLMLPGLLGGRMPLHATAGGKAFLTWASPARQKALIKPPLERFTRTTITDVAELRRELKKSYERGYTIVNGEHHEEVVGVAAPIHNHQGDVFAALTVGGPRSRATSKIPQIAEAVVAAAASVSAALGYHDVAAPVPAKRGTRLKSRIGG